LVTLDENRIREGKVGGSDRRTVNPFFNRERFESSPSHIENTICINSSEGIKLGVQIVFYTIYKITNKLDGKIYIGKHQTKDLNDGYMGSGKILKRAIDKHGLENFTKEILFQFDNEADMNSKEAELVTKEFVKEDANYNLCPGGNGGWGYINSTPEIYTQRNIKNLEKAMSSEARLKASKNTDYSKLGFSVADKKTLREFARRGSDKWKGSRHTDSSKEKMSKAQSGALNSQSGTMWITNGKENKKIKKDSIIPVDWYRGRVAK
jgi:hypothetical protein